MSLRPQSITRKLLSWLFALAVALPMAAFAAATPAHAVGPDLLPVTVTNNTGRNEPVHLYVIGQDVRPGGRLGYVNGSGGFSNWPAGSQPPSPAPDVSIPGPGNGASKTIYFPRFLSARVYFSIGEKLKFFLTPDGLVQPAPWAGGDPNRDILFDWSEFTYNDAGLWLNSSQVDQFAIPHGVSVTGSDGATKRTGDVVNNGRENIINAIKAQPGWANTVYTRGDGTVLRVLAPGKAADGGQFDRNYLAPYIDSAWNAYTGKTLTVVPFQHQPDVKYFGRTSGNVMNFTDASGRQVHSINKPSTSDVWGCDGALHAPNDLVKGPIARSLCAALNRSTLGTIDTQPSYNAADFYRGPLTNHYSRIIHANMVDGKAYGFAFDDVGAFESLVHDGNPRSAAITLSPFGAGGPGGGSGVGYPVVGPGGKCMDVAGDDNGGNGTAVQLWDCQSQAKDQEWTLRNNGTLQTLGKCLDVAGDDNGGNGTVVQLWDCQSNAKDQQWRTTPSGTLVNGLGRCLDSPGGASGNGARLQLWDCNGAPAQSFVYNGGFSNIIGPAGKCADVAGDDNGANGTAVQLWDCQDTARDQNWKWNGSTLTTLGRCLDVAGDDNGGNGAVVQLWDCQPNAKDQQWRATPEGTLVNVGLGRCLDSPGGASGNGTRLQIWDCNGAPAQSFRKS
ncbi:beta-1,3-glucanase family protein [Streptosporangium sp. NPDC050855]|uniref:beta-1,3-glucanase family protein n=1 Tax=Streptosporangium sp. NPDC050855 TaxID=3366194 RepID=UPI0037B77733